MTAEPAMPREESVESGAGKRFLDLAKRLVSVPKAEVDRLRDESRGDQASTE